MPGCRDVRAMIAGATTNARTAIGAVTAAQIPRILAKEYCAELSAALNGARATVLWSCRQLWPEAGLAHRPPGSRSADGIRRKDDARVDLEGDAGGAG